MFLQNLDNLLIKNCEEILLANSNDLENAKDITPALKKRLALTEDGIMKMAHSARQVAALADPVGKVFSSWSTDNGLKVSKMRVPIGVIFFVFESRPNVIVDAAALAIKSGNVLIARGGKEAKFTNDITTKLIQEALGLAGLSQNCVQQLADRSHEAIYEVVRHWEYVDLVVARGREQLIRSVK